MRKENKFLDSETLTFCFLDTSVNNFIVAASFMYVLFDSNT